jgi:SAM-dependent methyltransferase
VNRCPRKSVDADKHIPFLAMRTMNTLSDPKTAALVEIIRQQYRGVLKRVLVVGCGSGVEAAVLAEELGAEVIGIDIVEGFDDRAARVAILKLGDATNMEFLDESFDFVYSYHALEHIPNYRAALHEMRRVLKKDGGFMIGTPNRNRLIGYLGSKNATFLQKVMWNGSDWRARVSGKFRNEYGAHAGYSLEELRSELAAVFGTVNDVTPAYYQRIYPNNSAVLSFLDNLRISRWLLPSIYFCGSPNSLPIHPLSPLPTHHNSRNNTTN